MKWRPVVLLALSALASAHAQNLTSRGLMHQGDTNVPFGALAFFRPAWVNGYYGHVMLSEGSPVPMGHLGFVYGLKRAAADARRTLADLNRLADRQYVPASSVALVYAGLGGKANALDWLERAYQEHDFAMVFLDVAPWFSSLRGDPRFEELLRRMRLPARSAGERK